MHWTDPAENQFDGRVEGKPEAFRERVRKRAEQLALGIGSELVTWVQVQEAVQQIEVEDERRRP